MFSGEPGLGEQALSKLAEAGIASQLDEVEEINVDIRTNPLQLMMGKVDSVTVEGEGMVIKEELRVETIAVTTGAVSVNPLSAISGKIELTEPAEADARVVLKEEDLNRAFNSDFLRNKMQNLSVEVDGKVMQFDIQSVNVDLLPDGRISVDAEVKLLGKDQPEYLSATVLPHVKDGGYQIGLKDLFMKQVLNPPELTTAIVAKIMELTDLRNFNLPGMFMRLKELTVEHDRLTLETQTYIEEIPEL